MDRNNLNNLFLVGIVVFAVVIGGLRTESPPEITFEQKPETTSLVATVRETIPTMPFVAASAVLVKDILAVDPIWYFNADRKWPIASITKLMTAVIALEKIGLETQISISKTAVDTEGVAGFLEVGKVYTVHQLLETMLRSSSNDAAVALAEHYGWNDFMWAMNAKAQAIGMHNTQFSDSSGLSVLNQSTANDLEKLTLYIFNRHPEIFLLTRIKSGNIHPFVDHPEFLGGKTGFIDEANGNLLSLFNMAGRPILIIVLGSEDRAKDTETLYDRLRSR